MSLIEALVAVAILAIAVLIALAVYDAARGAFKKGENATAQQESVRIAYDRIIADMRMLGYNSDPDGNFARPDEKLEVALDHAIIFRGDFDIEDPAKVNDHEGALSGGAFDVVTTGNDEVVGYVLSKPDGTGPDTITFSADVDDEPRDGAVTAVTVNNVVLNPTSPPYTLYKISLNNNVGTCCNGAFIQRTPVVENVRNLSIQYYDATSVNPIAAPGATETTAAKAVRAGVNKFNVSLIGMTRDPDFNYNDATDAAARNYRKFELRGDVIPRNMAMKGRQDLAADQTPPSKPATPTLTPGHCGGLIVSWTPNPTSDGVNQYKVNFGTSAGAVDGSKGAGASPYFLAGLTTGTTYYVSIQALDGAGNISIKSNEASATVTNTNTPSAPTAPTASTGTANFVHLDWTATTTNTASVPAADPMAPGIRDLAGYRIYRANNSGVNIPGDLYLNETTVVPPGNPPYDDTGVVNCHTYYYRVAAVDSCGTISAGTSAFSGSSTTSTPPAAPTNVQAFTAGANRANVTWTAVTKDTLNNAITIGAYDVYRSNVVLKTDPVGTIVWPTTPLATSTTNSYVDNGVPPMTSLQTIYYRVVAKDECVNYSAPSSEAQATCAFSGTVTINPPIDGAPVAGVVPAVTVTVSGGTDTYTGVVITYTHSIAGVTRTYTSATTATTWTDNGWLATPAGSYTITAVVTNSTGCTSTTSITVNAGASVACCLSLHPATATTLSCTGSGSKKCYTVAYKIGNNACLTSAQINAMTVAWTDASLNQPRWQTAQFNGVAIAAAGSWTTTYSGTPEAGTATKSNFSAPKPEVPYTPTINNINATTVTYVFNNNTDSGSGVSRKVDVFTTNQYVFELLDSAGNASGITGTCSLAPITGLTVN
jgi:hypothetical protein